MRAIRYTVLACHLGLMAGLIVAGGWLGALAAVPLLAPLRGLWRGRAYTYAWASMLLTFYAAAALAEAYAQPARQAWAFGLAALAGAEFIGLILFVRRTRGIETGVSAGRSAS